MKIGILGSGTVAKELAKGFLRIGHNVQLGTRSQEKLSAFKSENQVSLGSFSETAQFGDLVILATHGLATLSVIELAGKENFSNKTVIDVTNALEGYPPKFSSSPGNSLGEKIQSAIPNANVVKAFNTISVYIMTSPKREEGDPDFLLAGNDEASKAIVASIAKELGWKNIIDIGDISKSYLLEAFAMLWIEYGLKNKQWTHAFKLLKK